jgi:uncharacterized Tic20 family protein
MEEIKIYPESERNWAMFCHLSAFAGLFFPFGGIIGPMIFWLSRKDTSELVDRNGRASLNFQLSMLLYTVLCIPLFFLLIGFLILGVLLVVEIVSVVVASIRAANGQDFSYPLTIPFIQ